MLRDTRFACTVGRIRVAETRMLHTDDWERLLEMSSVDGLLRLLHERGYPESGDYEWVLNAETVRLFRYMEEITPNPEFFSLFLVRNDCHNLKVLLKNEYSGGTEENMLVENGVFGLSRLKEMVRDRDLSEFPEPIRDAFFESMDLFSRTRDPQLIDILLDQAYHTHFFDAALACKNPFLNSFATIRIDTGNIKAFVRIKRSMEQIDLLTRVVVDRGTFSRSEFVGLLSSGLEQFNEWLYQTPYRELAGFPSAAVLEKQCDDLIMRFLRKTRYKVFGIEPVIGYLLGRETEINNIRIIAVGKTNGIEPAALRERMRLCYV